MSRNYRRRDISDGVYDLADPGHSLSYIHACHSRKMECLQGHLSARLTYQIGQKFVTGNLNQVSGKSSYLANTIDITSGFPTNFGKRQEITYPVFVTVFLKLTVEG